jgi:cobyrinic acid a,c-diamide synthase
MAPPHVRLGIARDAAFHFYYADNLESLARAGVQCVPFSPLEDTRLPHDLDGLYFGGGYPELYAQRLATNAALLGEIRQFATSGRSIYAECGGLMYLGRSLRTVEGARFPLVGLLPIETAMLPKLRSLGYSEVAWRDDSLWGPAGQIARGHEFHYSHIVADESSPDGWQPAYTVRRGPSEHACVGFCKGNVLAGYVHLHWASRPEAISHFLSRCGNKS